MMVLKMLAAISVAVLLLMMRSISGAAVASGTDGGSIVLPTTADALFSDVYNNNSITLQILARQAQVTSAPYIQKIADGTYMAVNFAMGNSLWVVTPENTIIVFDVPESNEISLAIRKAMRNQSEIGTKPITYLFYSIFQGDHTFGAQPLMTDPYNNGVPPVIVAHKNMVEQAEFFDTFSFIKMNRILRVFGTFLPPKVATTAFTPLSLGAVQYLQYYPSVFLDLKEAGNTQDLTFNGLSFTAIYVPGYTEDQLAFWFPATKVIHIADIFYGLLQNIYAIRGEPARDAMAWSNTARIVQSYNAEVVYPSHGLPFFGKNYIYNLLGKSADVIQYIHDQTVRLLGKGYTPDVVSRLVKLPETYTSEPEFGEFYGALEGHSKAITDYYTGWFNGQGEDLLPLSKPELASNMVQYFGRDGLMEKARQAYENGDYRWSLTLATHVWLYENKPLNDALYWRTQSLKRLAENLPAVQWRNYLFTEAMVNWKVLPTPYLNALLIRSRPSFMRLHTLSNCFTLLRVHLNAQLASGVDKTIDISVTDDTSLQNGQNCLSTGTTCLTGRSDSCQGRPDGDYQACESCNVYHSCSGGIIYANRQCPLTFNQGLNGRLVWVQVGPNQGRCDYSSSTCRQPSCTVYRLRIVNSILTANKVAAVDPSSPTGFPFIQTTNTPLRQVLAGVLTIDNALATNAVTVVRGSSNDIKSFLDYFDFVDQL